MPTLAEFVRQKQWEPTAVYLLLGLVEALSKLPRDAVVGLIDVVEGEPDGEKG